MRPVVPTLALVLLVAGCAATPQSEEVVVPTPTETVSMNEAGCDLFSAATIKVGNAVVDSTAIDLDIPAEFDAAALRSEGDVKDRIASLIDNLPTPPHMIGWMDNRDAYSADVMSVTRACEAAGFPIQAATLVGG